ncbi:MAG: hypothetical protein CSB33_00870 [Desulfobacterales bacterium]|nr:MAG: hypothetical protein CSB33_00870 [Desulfobacterales bacterium]
MNYSNEAAPQLNATSYYGVPVSQTQYDRYTAYPAPPATVDNWFQFNNPAYVKGLVVGAAVALVAANPTVQRAVVSGVVKLWTGLQGGVEEIKEHVKDVKAEISSKE